MQYILQGIEITYTMIFINDTHVLRSICWDFLAAILMCALIKIPFDVSESYICL